MHIQRINGIKNFRIFQDFKTRSDSEAWQPITVIYGANGSGKSTLASLFSALSAGAAQDSGTSVEVFRRQSVIEKIDATSAFWQSVRVFNHDYVQENLKFEHDGSGGVSAEFLLTLGKDRIKTEARIKEITEERAKIAENLPPLKQTLVQATKRRDNILTQAAKDIGRELGRAGGRFDPRSYKAPTLRTIIDQGQSLLKQSASTDIAADTALMTSQVLPKLSWRLNANFEVDSLAAKINEIRATSVTSQVLDELASNRDAADWVQTGLKLHTDRETCLFCAGAIPGNRRTDIEAHFDESFRLMQDAIRSAKQSIAHYRSNVEAHLASMPKKAEIYTSLHEAFDQAVALSLTQKESFFKILDAMELALVEKESSPFSLLPPMDEGLLEGLSFSELDEVVTRCNQQSDEFDSLIKQAAVRIESYRALQSLPDYEAASKDTQEAQDEVEKLQVDDSKLYEELMNLSSADLDPLPHAKRLNKDLAALLGRREITFIPVGERYEIRRGKSPATDLSEGERNAISLLYFLCSLEKHEDKGKDLIVVIDDPVSSFDDNTLYGASAHLWSRLAESGTCNQLIVLTHSFNFFRTWSNQLDRRFKRDKKRMPHVVKELSSSITQTASGELQRKPQLIDWPDDDDLRVRLRSEYHYLFWTLGRTLTDAAASGDPMAQTAAGAVMPNVARRLLESFLAFKRPAEMGNFEASVAVGMEGLDEVVRIRMTKFLHRFSHNEQGDIDAVIRPGEALPVLASVFSLIHASDEDHFTGTCTSLNLDPDLLLGLAGLDTDDEEDEKDKSDDSDPVASVASIPEGVSSAA